MDKIRVLLVDDQEIITRGLKMILEAEDDIVVTGAAADGREACRLCREQKPHVVLMDIRMLAMDGVEATGIIKRDCPEIAVIILTTFNDDQYIFEALKKGACGYLLKESSTEEIVQAVRAAYRGGSPIQPAVAVRVVEEFSRLTARPEPQPVDPGVSLLTEREREIARLVGEGKSNREIAGKLHLSEGTVRNYLSVILSKLEFRGRTQLAIFALKNNLINI